ncbi:MAG: hypothetical protein A2X49_16415 [Lentisphaerae bacterium GWF2_52_8]|nr:MAG: hypothetical protein A2X49_16415 [Lentisphaerae bacterium GWF2_52_8]
MSENDTSLTEHSLRGEVSRIVYENPDAGYLVLRLRDAQGVEHSVVGQMNGVYEGQGLEVSGVWERHKEYGRQLRASRWQAVLPATSEGIKRYLASGVVHGLGPKLAECIVAHFGVKTLEVLEQAPVRLREVPGIGKKRIETIRKAWKEQAERRGIYIFLQGLGISPAFCHRVYKAYGEAAPDKVRANPYLLAEDVHGIGFSTADRVAASLGIAKNDLHRLSAGILYSLVQLRQEGHVCYPQDKLVSYAAELLQVPPEEAEAGLKHAIENRKVILEQLPGNSECMSYDPSLYEAEVELPQLVGRLASVRRHKGEFLLRQRPTGVVSFGPEQLAAVERVGHSPLSIITGGPGVGKTTVVSEIVRRANCARLKVALAAPTGRAAKRLSESCRRPAMTIHRLLKWEPVERRFVYGKDRFLPCDLLIVDEVSMLDLQLAVSLFRAIRPGTTLVLVGDADQLPSVGPGTVFSDFLRSGLFAVSRLSTIYRQGEGSKIITSAHAVNRGESPSLPQSKHPDALSDFYWIEQEDPEEVCRLILRMVKERIPARFGFDPMRDIQVLAPMNRGSCGTITLNEILQRELNPGSKPQFKYGDRTFKSGDRVMQVSNNYDKGVFNGDMGLITNVNTHERSFRVLYDDMAVDYEFADADQLSLAYAITVHKAQGSEFPALIVPILTQHYMMLQRTLLYTAMTRARRLLVLIGSRKAVAMAVRNASLAPRYSQLLQRLKLLNLPGN